MAYSHCINFKHFSLLSFSIDVGHNSFINTVILNSDSLNISNIKNDFKFSKTRLEKKWNLFLFRLSKKINK